MPSRFFISPKRLALIIALVGGIWAFFLSSHNVQYAKDSGNPRVQHGMITTADDASYLRPPENFLRDGIWKDNTQGLSSYIQRPPGMGVIHLFFYSISSTQYAILHKIFAIMLHVLAIYLLGLTAQELAGKKAASIIQCTYALLPCFWGYLFYYITESITPSLMVFLFYGYVKHHYRASSKWLILQALISGLILLIRPQLIIFVLPFIYFLIRFLKESNAKKASVFLLAFMLAFGGIISWQIRSTVIAKRYTGLHGIYDVTNNSQYRPVHKAFGELFKIWESNGEYFHTVFGAVWYSALDENHPKLWENHIRLFGCKGISNDEIQLLLLQYHAVIIEQRDLLLLNQPMPGETPREKELRSKVETLTRQLKKKNLFLCYINTPLRSAKFMFTKSQLNMDIFQYRYRGLWWMETLRYLCLGLIILSTMVSLSRLLDRKNKAFMLFAVSLLAYLFYLFFIQKMNEERYLIPIIPLMLQIMMATFFNLFGSGSVFYNARRGSKGKG